MLTPTIFEQIENDESFLKLRIFAISAFISSFIFYYFMTLIDPSHVDWLPGRLAVSAISAIVIAGSFYERTTFFMRRIYLNSISIAYILMYLFLLSINDWSLFHRWSYFVVIAIMATVVFSWTDYIYTAGIGLILPIFAGYFGPLSFLELVHFHAANFVTFFVIGLTVRANFKYRDQVYSLTKGLIQNSKMIALGEMSAGISHEINNPLAIITNSAAQIELSIHDVDRSKQTVISALEKISKAVQRIVKIVQGLHDFSQGDSTEEFQKVDLRRIVCEAINLSNDKFSSGGVKIIQEITQAPATSHGQTGQLVQVMLNLIGNAYDACIGVKEAQVTIRLTTIKNQILISVSDNGPGVAPEIESQIMQPFFTTKPIGKGTGLGLSTSLGIAKYHKGELYLDRTVSDSCFTLKLPIA
jgi:signal transduction histidine kinase